MAEDAADAARDRAGWLVDPPLCSRLLEAVGRLRAFSVWNALLLTPDDPGKGLPDLVYGWGQWEVLGRRPRAGVEPVLLCSPVMGRRMRRRGSGAWSEAFLPSYVNETSGWEDSWGPLHGFTVAYAFDLAMTEGDPVAFGMPDGGVSSVFAAAARNLFDYAPSAAGEDVVKPSWQLEDDRRPPELAMPQDGRGEWRIAHMIAHMAVWEAHDGRVDWRRPGAMLDALLLTGMLLGCWGECVGRPLAARVAALAGGRLGPSAALDRLDGVRRVMLRALGSKALEPLRRGLPGVGRGVEPGRPVEMEGLRPRARALALRVDVLRGMPGFDGDGMCAWCRGGE